ncbi:MAG: TonB family protein [Candidatus Aminicenantales bacterium]
MAQPFGRGDNPHRQLAGLKALVVDFDIASLEALASFLRQCGLDVLTARDGVTGLNLFRQHQPQVVLIEAMLPKMSGFELSKQIQIESQGKVPVIIITGIYKDTRHKIEAVQTYGAAAFFTKPWKREDLEACLVSLTGPAVVPSREEDHLLDVGLKDFPDLAGLKPPLPTATSGKTRPKLDLSPKSETKEAKPKKTPELSADVDKLLEKTLADLGFGLKKTPASETKKQTPPSVETRPPEIKISPAESKPKEEKAKPFSSSLKLTPEPPIKSAEIPKPSFGPPKKIAEPPKPPEVSKPAPETAGPAVGVHKNAATTFKLEVQTAAPTKPIESMRETAEQPRWGEKGAEDFETELRPAASSPKGEEKLRAANNTGSETGFSRYPASAPFLFGPQEESRKKPSTSLIIGIAGIAALVIAAVFLLKPKKTSLPPTNSQTLVASALTEEPAPESASRLEEQAGTPQTTRTKTTAASILNQLPLPPAKKEEAIRDEKPPVLLAEPPPTPPLPLPQVKMAEPPSPQSQTTNPATENLPPAQKLEETTASVAIKEGDLIPLDEIDVQPRAIKTVEPKYPPLAQQIGLEGSVLINALISENGDVIRTEILRGIKNGASLENAAEAAIRQWKFTPAMKNGVKVKVWKPIETRFRLKQ